MILSQIIAAEVAETEMLEGDSDDDKIHLPDDADANDGAAGVIHHDIIELIHKEIMAKSHQSSNEVGSSEGLIFEGIVHLDSRESHYRVKTEILNGMGPVFAVKIVTMTSPSSFNLLSSNLDVSNNNSSQEVIDLSSESTVVVSNAMGAQDSNEELIKQTSRDREPSNVPIDFSSPATLLDANSYSSVDQDGPQITGTGRRANALKNKVREVLRGPVNYSSGGAAGFGFAVQKSKRGDVLNLFLCPFCVYCCVKKGELKKHHTAVHLDGKPYGCTFCSYRSTHKSTLRSHVMSRHTGERPYECPDCDYKASQKGLVDKHIMTKHTGEKPFKCPFCDFSSSHSSTVKTHVMFKHTGEKPFKCPTCDYRAVQRGHILRHMKAVHTGEKPFKCTFCEYRACRLSNLKKHEMAIHTKEKPYICPHCDFKSSHKGNLSSHLISKHTDIKPFSCPHCQYKSSCRTGLNRHLQKHTGVKKRTLMCHYCNYTSDRKDHMRTHVTYVHFKGQKITSKQLDELIKKVKTFSNESSKEVTEDEDKQEEIKYSSVLAQEMTEVEMNVPSTSCAE